MKKTKIMFTTLGIALFVLSAITLFKPTDGPTGFFVSATDLVINNYNNKELLNNNLKIDFMTRGTKDLTIITPKGDMEFVELNCNNQPLRTSVQDNKIEYKDNNWEEDSYVMVKVLSKELVLQFRFGTEIQQVKNIAP